MTISCSQPAASVRLPTLVVCGARFGYTTRWSTMIRTDMLIDGARRASSPRDGDLHLCGGGGSHAPGFDGQRREPGARVDPVHDGRDGCDASGAQQEPEEPAALHPDVDRACEPRAQAQLRQHARRRDEGRAPERMGPHGLGRQRLGGDHARQDQPGTELVLVRVETRARY
eukprot:3466889-Rhodomonas_salina.2